MGFGLKAIMATYQWAMMVIFKEILGDMVESYVDDLFVKSHQRIDYLKHLIVFDKLCHSIKEELTKMCVRGHNDHRALASKEQPGTQKGYKAILRISTGSSQICLEDFNLS